MNIVVQVLNHVQLFMVPWTVARQAPLSSTISYNYFTTLQLSSKAISDLCQEPGSHHVVLRVTLKSPKAKEKRGSEKHRRPMEVVMGPEVSHLGNICSCAWGDEK